jgi:CRISPR-associated protein Csm1
LHRWAWAVPCSYGEPGVSLYDEFRALSALVHASGCGQTPADGFLLVGGDIPGIQDFVYTITSKGAAKGLRGRSFFIQLLGDAIVRRLLADLVMEHPRLMRRLLDAWDLPGANVIYTAGGNFMLLAPTGDRDKVAAIAKEINLVLLDTYEGEIALCLACMQIPGQVVGRAEFGSVYSRSLKEAIGRETGRRFASIANDDGGWRTVFAPRGDGGEKPRFCAVCQAELTPEELGDPNLVRGDVVEGESGEGVPRACYDCDTFRKLAEAIGRPRQALYLRRGQGQGERWQELLHDLSGGWWYRFGGLAAPAAPGEIKMALNDADFVRHGGHGFSLLANTTPRVTPQDVAWWDRTYPEQAGELRAGSIRSFELLAQGAERDGVLGRVGVLRMDVDDLGKVMTRGLVYNGEPHRSLPATSALSDAVERYFAGYLDRLCTEVTRSPDMAGLPGHDDEDLLYVIYAGGDDLFVVGAWHLLPLLAQRVRDAFEAYTGGNPSLHISAGMTLESPKFPLYQAATRAGKALDGGAKQHHTVEGQVVRKKNAAHLLGQTLGWEDLFDVKQRAGKLATLVRRGDVPRGLLQTLQMIYGRFLADQQAAREPGSEDEPLYYGPWMWQQAYYLSRFAEGKPDAVKDEVKAIQKWMLRRDRIQYLGLVTRWAEYLTRGKEE